MRPWAPALAVLIVLPTGISALVSPPTGLTDVWIWSPSESSADLAEAWLTVNDWTVQAHRYDELGMLSFLGTELQAQALLGMAGGHVERNRAYTLHLDESVPLVRADVVAESIGYVRDGPSVLVIDTGVDSAHPDFQDGNLAANFAAERFGGLVIGTKSPDVVVDEAGHGTHVAGIVAGSGYGNGPDDSNHDRYRGIYHTGRIVGFQALADSTGDDGEAQVDTAAALEAIEWALRDGHKFDVKVIQASWGTGGDFDPTSAINKATLEAYLGGMNVVFSAGNRGDDEDALNSFCQAPWVLCVASVDNDGKHSKTSSVGISSHSTRPYAHPDLAAPGSFVTASSSTTDTNSNSNGFREAFDMRDDERLYETRTGTSMAAPHVSGAAALLLAANPDLSPDQVMDVLVHAAARTSQPIDEVGAGMINVREAYLLAILTPGNRAEFEDGAQVKYGGPATGDDAYALDPITVGYTKNPDGTVVELPPMNLGHEAMDFLDQASSTVGLGVAVYAGIGLGVLLGVVLLVRIPVRRRLRH